MWQFPFSPLFVSPGTYNAFSAAAKKLDFDYPKHLDTQQLATTLGRSDKAVRAALSTITAYSEHNANEKLLIQSEYGNLNLKLSPRARYPIHVCPKRPLGKRILTPFSDLIGLHMPEEFLSPSALGIIWE